MADYIVVADKNLPTLNEKINAAVSGGLMPIGEPVYAYGIFVQPCARMSAFPYITGTPQSIIADRDISSLAARVQALAGTGVSPSGGMQAFEGLFLQRMGMPDDMSSGGTGGGSQFAGIELMSADGWLQWRNKGEQTWHALEPLDTFKAQPNVLKVGAVRTLSAGSQADVVIKGDTPDQVVDFAIPAGEDAQDITLDIGTVTTLPPGSQATVQIRGQYPNLLLDVGIPSGEDGEDGNDGKPGENGQSIKGDSGPANELSVGTVSSSAFGTNPVVTISGKSPNQVINFTIPGGKPGDPAPATKFTVGTVTALAAGSTPTVQISGTAPNYTLSFGIPMPRDGKDGVSPVNPNFAIGNVASGAAAASITGTYPDLKINLTLPPGKDAVNPTPLNYETISATVATAGTKVPVTFAKKYAVPPAVDVITSWNGSQMVSGFASEVTTTGCNVLVMQSVGTLLLNGSPFGNAPAGTTCRLLVLGTGA